MLDASSAWMISPFAARRLIPVTLVGKTPRGIAAMGDVGADWWDCFADWEIEAGLISEEDGGPGGRGIQWELGMSGGSAPVKYSSVEVLSISPPLEMTDHGRIEQDLIRYFFLMHNPCIHTGDEPGVGRDEVYQWSR